MSNSPKSRKDVPEHELDDEQLDDVSGGLGHEIVHTVQQAPTTLDSTSASSEHVVQRNEADLAFARR